MSDLLHVEGQGVVPLQDLGGAEPQQLEDDADVTAVLEPVQHPHTRTGKKTACVSPLPKQPPTRLSGFHSQFVVVVQAVDLLQHCDLRLGHLGETVEVAADLHGHVLPSV